MRAFEKSDYRWLWGENFAISSARYSIILISGWMSYSFTNSVIGSSVVAFLGFAPPLLFGPFIGMLADKLDKRLLIKVGAALGAAVSLLALTASELGKFNLALSLALALVAGISFTLEAPSRTSLIPSIIGENGGLLNAYSWIRVASQGSEFIGPAITTVLLATYGSTLALVIPALMYCLSLILTFMIKSGTDKERVATELQRKTGGATEEAETLGTAEYGNTIAVGSQKKRSDLVEGFSYIRGEKAISILILLVGLHCSLTMAYMGLLPSFSVSSLKGGDSVYGILLTAVGLGAIVWSIGLARYAHNVNKNQVLVVTAVLSGATLSLLALTSSPILAYLTAFFVGGSQAMFMSLIQSSTQSLSRAEMRGRVAGLSFFFTAGIMGFSGLAQGFLALVIGTQLVMIVTGLAFVAVVAVMLRSLPNLRMSHELSAQ
ncbi:MAG: MFS transporter [Nitrososphaerota archaeon]|nr:MFS transporter [Nitrososphaerota archaeon]